MGITSTNHFIIIGLTLDLSLQLCYFFDICFHCTPRVNYGMNPCDLLGDMCKYISGPVQALNVKFICGTFQMATG